MDRCIYAIVLNLCVCVSVCVIGILLTSMGIYRHPPQTVYICV